MDKGQIVETDAMGQLEVRKVKLSDGSYVYDLYVGTYKTACNDYDDAMYRFKTIRECID